MKLVDVYSYAERYLEERIIQTRNEVDKRQYERELEELKRQIRELAKSGAFNDK